MTVGTQSARLPYDQTSAWHALSPLLKPYLPWSTGAMRPAGLVTVLNEVWFGNPALAALGSRLATGATIVLDDVERAGEQAVLVRWQQEHGLVFDLRPTAGVAVASWPGG